WCGSRCRRTPEGTSRPTGTTATVPGCTRGGRSRRRGPCPIPGRRVPPGTVHVRGMGRPELTQSC
ncbi:MAG: hypothetical protein AVDCRST_MAG70-2074, partial [uncultured Thermomicrobiales bacterium]